MSGGFDLEKSQPTAVLPFSHRLLGVACADGVSALTVRVEFGYLTVSSLVPRCSLVRKSVFHSLADFFISVLVALLAILSRSLITRH